MFVLQKKKKNYAAYTVLNQFHKMFVYQKTCVPKRCCIFKMYNGIYAGLN